MLNYLTLNFASARGCESFILKILKKKYTLNLSPTPDILICNYKRNPNKLYKDIKKIYKNNIILFFT